MVNDVGGRKEATIGMGFRLEESVRTEGLCKPMVFMA